MVKGIQLFKLKFDLKFLAFSLTIILNYWMWRILANDIFLALALLILTISLYMLKNKRANLRIICLLFILVSILTIKSGLDRDLWVTSYKEENKFSSRHLYYAAELGNIYLNKTGTFINKKISPVFYQFESNIFSSLDLNLYFFASHPRERPGIEEFQKYHFLFLPFFIAGCIFIGAKRPGIILGYLLAASLISGVISPGYKLGPVLFFPLISSSIAFGLILIVPKLINIFKIQIK